MAELSSDLMTYLLILDGRYLRPIDHEDSIGNYFSRNLETTARNDETRLVLWLGDDILKVEGERQSIGTPSASIGT